MREPLKYVLKGQCCALTIAMSGFGAPAETMTNQQQEITQAMPTKIDQSSRMLEEFEKSKSIDALQGALSVLEHTGTAAKAPSKPAEPTDAILHFKQLVRMRLRILSVIERNEDKKFSPSAPPPDTIFPPQTDDGGLLPGADPKYIKDPVARAQYAAALKQNQEDRKQWYFQFRLKRMDELITLHLGTLIPLAYSASESDQKELDALLQELGVSEARRQKLKASFGKGQGK